MRLLEKDPEMLEVVREEESQCLTEIEELEVWAACDMLANVTLSMAHNLVLVLEPKPIPDHRSLLV